MENVIPPCDTSWEAIILMKVVNVEAGNTIVKKYDTGPGIIVLTIKAGIIDYTTL